MSSNIRLLRNVTVAMRDGTRLAATIYLPADPAPCPAVLVRTAYNRSGFYDPFFPAHGMALVVQDTRGRYGSEGTHYPFAGEQEDGFDTLEWLAAQPWCDGRIGMYGDSYLAATQFAAVRSGSPRLAAVAPRFMAGDCWKRAYYIDGVCSLALTWSWLAWEVAGRTSEAASMPLVDVPRLLRGLPILALDEASGAGAVQAYRDYVKHNTYDDHWRALDLRPHYGDFACPVLTVGGWYDNYAAEAVRNHLGITAAACSPQLAASHRLLIGPWTHGINPSSILGELDFGPEALRENDATQRWLDCILHGRGAEAFMPAPIRLFTLGTNRWRDAAAWPLPGTRQLSLYLRQHGELRPEAPAGAEAPDRFLYDPADPCPTLGGNHSVGPYNPGLYEHCRPGPFDQRPVEARRDVLSYTTAPLERDTDVTGFIRLELHAATSARDTDWAARLCDVYPDGRSINITEGVIRARFRDDVHGAPSLLEPGRAYAYTIDLQAASCVFLAGHRVRLDITSSSFPLWDRNLNTGEDPAAATRWEVAEQTVLHDAARPSRLLLSVVEG